jgi:hypothetical protein
VVVIRERGGETLPGVFKSESAALSWVRHRVAKGTVLHADEAPSWNDLHARFELKRIDHQAAYSLDGAARIGRSRISQGCVVGRLATITTSLALTCSASRKRAHGAKTAAASPTASKCSAW